MEIRQKNVVCLKENLINFKENTIEFRRKNKRSLNEKSRVRQCSPKHLL